MIDAHGFVYFRDMEQTGREYEILRRMTPEKKLAVMHALIRQAYALKAASIRAARPERRTKRFGFGRAGSLAVEPDMRVP